MEIDPVLAVAGPNIHPHRRFSKDGSALLLIDHQSGIMQLNRDYSAVDFRNATIALAKVGKAPPITCAR